MKKSCYSSRAKYLHSFTISVRDESMWQSQTHERVGQVSFFVVLSLFSFLVFSVFLLLSLSLLQLDFNSGDEWQCTIDLFRLVAHRRHSLFFFFVYDFFSPSLSLLRPVCVYVGFVRVRQSLEDWESSFFFSSWLVLFFVHRAYQWNFRTTAAPASGDDINIHIVLFITSGFLLEKRRNLRCTQTDRKIRFSVSFSFDEQKH